MVLLVVVGNASGWIEAKAVINDYLLAHRGCSVIRAGIAADTPQRWEIVRLWTIFRRGVGVESPALSLGRRGTHKEKVKMSWY